MTPYDTLIVAVNGSVKSIKYSDFDERVDLVSVLLDCTSDVIPNNIRAESNSLSDSYKWYLVVRVSFKKSVVEREIEQTGVFRSRTQLVLPGNADDVDEQYVPVSYTHLDVYKRQVYHSLQK